MQSFDCLAENCSLWGPHLLEASAGTGKTFAIEHIYVRLILESVDVEQILVITFTRAATRELKARIRANLEKCLCIIRSGETHIEYLQKHLKSKTSIQLLSDALSGFDRCQVFTIHGFCYRMLKEFAFEANIGIISNPDENNVSNRLAEAARDFLQHGLSEDLLCKEQMELLLKKFESIEKIVEKLIKMEEPKEALSFGELFDQCKAALHSMRTFYGEEIDPEKVLADFKLLEKGFKATVKGDFASQAKALAKLDEVGFRVLLKEKGTIFSFLAEGNKKVKYTEPSLHYPRYFERAGKLIAPLLKKNPFSILQKTFNLIAERILQEEEEFNNDELLLQMRRSVDVTAFAQSVRGKYQAALIDEFQDTDAVQWEIFQKIFLTPSLRSIFLVGDPKQSIYRFRKADVYTYFSAKNLLGDDHVYYLDTNYRSCSQLIGALNSLFSRKPWLVLPKTKTSLPYYPVKAGAKLEPLSSDQKGALHCIIAEGDPKKAFEEIFLPYAAREIEELKVKNIAILLKDRYQIEKALRYLRKRGIPAVAKSHVPIGKTVGFQGVYELFEAVISPHDQNRISIVMAGPFGQLDSSFAELKVILQEKGLVPFAKKVLKDVSSPDILQVFELLFEWEREKGFSLEGIRRFFVDPELLNTETKGKRRIEVDENAVQIMTMHVSKGLEFDVVFPFGLAFSTSESEEAEEVNAEKLRQLYVAMTRAKRRLYIPVIQETKEQDVSKLSPMELFFDCFEGTFLDEISLMAKSESITLEQVSSPIILPGRAEIKPQQETIQLKSKPFTPMYLSSFSSMARVKESDIQYTEQNPSEFNLQTMPRGSETGLVLHKIFELIFSPAGTAWKDLDAACQILDQEVDSSHLILWKKAIQEMVRQVLSMPLRSETQTFCLADIDRVQPEMEFVFSNPPHFIKGFIDLVFLYKNQIYFLDWKSNWLEEYNDNSLKKAMDTNDYTLQAALYSEALQRYASKYQFGGAFYIFLRGPAYFHMSNFDGILSNVQL